MTKISNKSDVNKLAQEVLLEAMQACNEGTFPVGGAIIDNQTGEVIYKMHNKVVQQLKNGNYFTKDPTAHGERQLVYWYYQNKALKNLKAPECYTVLTTLDPCVMCTGALLAAGFNVGVIAMDDYAGINYDSKFEFPTLPENLQKKAKASFTYYASGGTITKYQRAQQGEDKVGFENKVLSPINLMGCGAVFNENVQKVRDQINLGRPVDQLQDPYYLNDTSPVKQKFKSKYENAFKIKVSDTRLPDQRIYSELKKAAPDGGNAVAFLDYFGNLVLCLGDDQSVLENPRSSIKIAFMNVVQTYAQTRWELMNEADNHDAEDTLSNPKDGTFVFLYAPNPRDALTVMTLGAYGSTMEGPIPRTFPLNFQYYHPPQAGGTAEDLVVLMTKLPPLYTKSIQVGAMQVIDANFRQK